VPPADLTLRDGIDGIATISHQDWRAYLRQGRELFDGTLLGQLTIKTAPGPMTGGAMALVIGVSWACVGDLFGVGDYGDMTDEGVFHGGAEEEVSDVRARG
jgi:hypothetical protein